MGDIANLKAISKPFQNSDALPLDYYTVFAELEKQLADEFDFVNEAVAVCFVLFDHHFLSVVRILICLSSYFSDG
jgi:hypothetical protein